ncbi:MAG TPA: lasso peptide biosynthesis B2 protein [Vineibacter sp.]|nr:lasso peptide biosynthesis B2 protein [Vineibacter sp.]
MTLVLIAGDGAPASGDGDYLLQPDAAVFVTDSGHAFVLNMADQFYAVPPVGALMLQRTLQQGEDSALRAVVDRYDVDRSVAQADLHRLLADLRQRGVLRRRGEPQRSPRRAFGAGMIARLASRIAAIAPSPKARAVAMVALARLSLLLFGWSATFSAWRRRVPLPPAVQAVGPRLSVDTIDAVVRSAASRLPSGASCKERALAAWALTRLAGLPSSLIVGIMQHPLRAHAWCETADARVVGDDVTICRRYQPVFRYG